jgi:hypothetical protein
VCEWGCRVDQPDICASWQPGPQVTLIVSVGAADFGLGVYAMVSSSSRLCFSDRPWAGGMRGLPWTSVSMAVCRALSAHKLAVRLRSLDPEYR